MAFTLHPRDRNAKLHRLVTRNSATRNFATQNVGARDLATPTGSVWWSNSRVQVRSADSCRHV